MSDKMNGYYVLAEQAELIGLTSGKHFNDNDHVQLRSAGSPMDAGLTLQQIDAAMKLKFGDQVAK
jgi:hypothetical protein